MLRSARPRLWWDQQPSRPRRHIQRAGQRGGGTFLLPEHARQQRVLVKPTVAVNRGPRTQSWYRHGVYLQREGAHGTERGLGFDAERNNLSISRTLAHWQRTGDPHMIKLIVSPEHSQRLDLQHFGRALMAEIARDLGTQMEWLAIDHHNTGQPHLHVVVRGRDAQGHELRIDGQYLWGGIRRRAREVATRMLGWRSALEITQSVKRAVDRTRWTALDQALRQKLDPERKLTLGETGVALTSHESLRLAVLAQRGLAWKTNRHTWELSRTWEQRLKLRGTAQEQQHERARQHDHKHGRDRGPVQTQEQAAERTGTDGQRRQRQLAQIIDQEHELGWDR
jgi:type IV secretory pathway VirD2 relaxase